MLPILSLKLLTILLVVNFPAIANIHTSIEKLVSVNRIIQDEQGFIWLAGQHGLTRYDGNTSINFSSQDSYFYIPATWLHDVALAGDEFLLSTEQDGVYLFNPISGNSQKLGLDTLKTEAYNAITFENHFYLYLPDKLYRFNPLNQLTELIAEQISIRSFAKTSKYLYITSKEGLFRVDDSKLTDVLKQSVEAITHFEHGVVILTKNKLQYIPNEGQHIEVTLNHDIKAIASEYSTDNFFTINAQGEIKRYHSKTLDEISHRFPKGKPVHARQLFQDNSGVLWIVSSQGVETLSENTLINHPVIMDIAINANEYAFIGDQLIVGSYGIGLQNFPNNTAFFDDETNNNFTQKALRITDLELLEQKLFIATFDGLWTYHLKSKTLNKVNYPNNDHVLLKLYREENLLYIASSDAGFMIYNLVTNKMIKHVNYADGLSAEEVIDILPTHNQQIWLATSDGLDIYNNNSKAIKNIDLPGSSKAIGLVLADNKVFVSTKGDGIFVFNMQGTIISRIGQNISFSQMKRVNDRVWAPSKQGLYYFSPSSYQLTLVPNTEAFTFYSSPMLFNQSIFATHYGGLLEVPIIEEKIFKPKVHISLTTISGELHLENKPISIKSSNDIVAFELASLDFRPGQTKQFQYQINGEQWNSLNANQLTLAGLASGNYRVAMRGTNSLGQWSDNLAYADINVAYSWYWTPQMRVLYFITALSSLLMALWLIYLRTKSIKQIHQVLSTDINKRGKISLSISKSLTNALSLLETQASTPPENNITESKQLINQAISALNSQVISDEPDSLQGNSLLDALSYLIDYAHKKHYINIVSKFELDDVNLPYELQSDVYKIIYEALTSAIMNGDGRNFTIHLQEFKQKLWITISDDESSFIHFKSKINFNMSMYFIRQIANKYKASVNTFDEHESGSQLIISIPLMPIM